MKVVLIGQDELGVRLSSHLQFRWPNTCVVATAEPTTAIELVQAMPAYLLFIDDALPNLDPLGALERVRSASEVPAILLLSKTNSHANIIRGLEAGADDCVVKPLELVDLLSRTKAVLRRSHGGEFDDDRPLVAGDLVVSFNIRQVSLSGRRVRLTPTEHKLLTLLVRNQGRTVPHELVFEHVWGQRSGNPSRIRRHVHGLRRKLGEYSANPCLVLAEQAMGYKLSCPSAR